MDPAQAIANELALLCRSCGLCCDGSLFGRARLDPDEVDGARRRGLRVVSTGASFEQPCAALVPSSETGGPLAAKAPARGLAGDTGGPLAAKAPAQGPASFACAIYGDRPRTCDRFTCKLYERHRREGGPIEERLAAVSRVRALLARLEPAHATAAGKDADSAAFEELVHRMDEDFGRA